MRSALLLAGGVLLLDQGTKLAVRGFSFLGFEHQGMALYESKPLVGDAVRVTFVENPGMAFGLNFDMPLVLSLFSLAAVLFLFLLLWKSRGSGLTGLRVALALILAGAAGNLIDRSLYGIAFDYASLFHGRVVDFIDVNLPDIPILGLEQKRFWVFNVADAAVSIGVVLLFFFYPAKAHRGDHSEGVADLPTARAGGTPSAAVDSQTVPGYQTPPAGTSGEGNQ